MKSNSDTERYLLSSAAGARYGSSTFFPHHRYSTLMLVMLLELFNQNVFAFHEEEVKVGVVVNTEAMLGKIALSAMDMSLSDFYSPGGVGAKYKTKLVLHVRDSPNNDVVSSTDAVLGLIKNERVHAIIGPETSQAAKFIINLGQRTQVPIISYSASSPHLFFVAPRSDSYFIQATQNDSAQIPAITSIIQDFSWRQVVPIYADDEFGGGVIPYLTDALQQIGTRIPYRSVISPSFTNDQIEAELYKLKSKETRVFIVHMEASLGMRIFEKANEIGMLEKGYVWIITSGIGNGVDDLKRSELGSMQGVVGVRTWVNDTGRVHSFKVRWKRKLIRENRDELKYPEMNMYGLWAYDAVEALARAVEKVGGDSNLTFDQAHDDNISESSNSSLTNLSFLGKSIVGPKILMELQGTKFDGLSGRFNLINGQLQSSTIEIINVIGNGEKIVGFWTHVHGLVKKMNSTTIKRRFIPKENLASITWPGDQMNPPPKGWVLPVSNVKKLKVLVPVKNGFTRFVNVIENQTKNETEITGYCIDIFDAVMKVLLYSVQYEYAAYPTPGKDGTESYNELITQVYYQKADIVVGDTTITANRSLYVDFSLPYTESGVKMLVPIKDNNRNKAWIFLRPLSWDLWVAILCFFVFIGFAIWVLEHRVNPQFRGPPQYQVGTSLYYSFTTMVFSHNQHILSNLARLVMVIWIFVVLILTQSYTASLTSMITVKQLQPIVTDVNDLLKTKVLVGFQQGSFFKDVLLQMGFKQKQLKSYASLDEMYQLFLKGTENGGISAAFDEIPYLELFLSKHCAEYMMVPPIYKTGGFGFAFPIGSPLVDDVSRAVLNVTQGKQMTIIEKRWIGELEKCRPNPMTSPTPTSSSLDLQSFWGLFTIAGCVTIFALVVFMVMFLHQHKQVWQPSDSTTSVWTRITYLAKLFDEKNMESHTFRKSEQYGVSTTNNSVCPPSSSIFSDRMEGIDGGFRDQSTFHSPSIPASPEHRHPQNNEDVVILETTSNV